MTKQKKYIATAATAALVASAIVPVASAAQFNDFDSIPSWAKVDVQLLAELGIFAGDQNGNFNATATLTRAEAAEVFRKAFKLETTGTEDFSDVDSSDWFYEAVVATSPELFEGDGTGKFAPKAELTRAQAAKVIVSAYGLTGETDLSTFPDAENVPAWAQEYFATAVANGVITGKGSKLAPNDDITRVEFASMIKRAIDAAEVEVEELTSGVSGFIMDGSDAVAGATVTVGEVSITTDENGYYEILDVPAGKHEVSIAAEGFKTSTVSDVTVLDEQVTALNQDISSLEIATSAIEVSGMIVDSATGAALNAEVALESFDTETEEWVEVATVTATNGKYTVNQENATPDLELGAEYRQTVKLDGYHDFVQTINLDDQEVVNALAGIQMNEIASMNVSGTVTDADGENVASANVTISDVDGNEVGTATVTNGAYSVEDLQLVSGTYNVVVDDSTSAVSYTEFEVVEGTDTVHNVQLEAGYTIDAAIGTESLSDVFGSSDADAGVYTLKLMNGNTEIASQTFTSAEGSDDTMTFDFARVAPGNYTLELSGDYVITEKFAITVDGNETLEERAVPAGLISGDVQDATNVVIEGATVNLLNADGNVVASTITEADGTYKFGGIVAGDYTVEVLAQGYVANEPATITVGKNTISQVSAIELAEVVTIGNVAGFVRVSGSLAPVNAATVVYYNVEGEEVASTTTDATGAYTLSGLAEGTYDVVVRGAGVETFVTSETIAAGENSTAVNYKLTDGGDASLKITVVDSEGNPVNVADNGFDLSDAFAFDTTTPVFGILEVSQSAAGTITLENLAAGTYDLTIDVDSADYVDVDTTVSIATGEEKELKIVVDEVAAQSEVNFRVINESNADVEDAKVVVFNEDGTIKTIVSSNAPLALVDGNYKLAVYKNGYVVSTTDLTIAAEDVTVPVIQLSPIK